MNYFKQQSNFLISVVDDIPYRKFVSNFLIIFNNFMEENSNPMQLKERVLTKIKPAHMLEVSVNLFRKLVKKYCDEDELNEEAIGKMLKVFK